MKRFFMAAWLMLGFTILFSSCKKADDNAKHIPADASAVFRVDMAAIGKKLAWEVLFGSDVFKKMAKSAGKDSAGMQDLQNAGIDFMNTFYSYVIPDVRYNGGQRFAALIPLSDKEDWEAYVKKTWPNAKLKTVNSRTEAMLNDMLYAGWNGDLLVMMNTASKEQMPDEGNFVPPVTDEIQTAAEMENTFSMDGKNSITENKRFTALAKEGHDISIFVNYETIMNSYGAGMLGGFTPTTDLMKDAAFTTGIDFEKGALKGDMKYYVSNELKDASKDLMSGKADKDMVERLPGTNLDLVGAMNLSPKSLKAMLDKFNLLGFMSIALTEQGLTPDDVFDSFTGDIAFTISNFRLVAEKHEYSYYNDNMELVTDSITNYEPEIDWLYVMKINQQEKFDKLFNLAMASGGLKQSGDGLYTSMSGTDGITIGVKDKYLVAGKNASIVSAYQAGAHKSEKLPEPAEKSLSDHPMAIYFDAQQMFAAITPESIDDKKDASRLEELKKYFNNAILSGGELKGDAFEYSLSINLNNKDENSLLQLIQMANAMAEIERSKEGVASR